MKLTRDFPDQSGVNPATSTGLFPPSVPPVAPTPALTITLIHMESHDRTGIVPPVPVVPAVATLEPLPTFYGTLEIVVTNRIPWLALTFKCTHCRCDHIHSWSLDAPVPTHRVAHCIRPRRQHWIQPSPLIERGYYVFPAPGVANDEVLGRFRELMKNERATFRRPLVDLADLVIDRDAKGSRWPVDDE